MQLEVNLKRYVCFNTKGEIEKISITPDEVLENLEVNFDEIKDLMSGKESLLNYKVEYDFIDKKYLLKNILQLQIDNTVNSFLYELPFDETDPEITICQNMKENCWQIEIDKDFFSKLGNSLNLENMFFSVTKKNDPNILYRMLRFNEDKIPFTYKFEFDKTPVSIYTVKKYSKYKFEVIDV